MITFESCSSQGMDLEAIGKEITDMKVAIGMIDHHSLQVETPKEVADHIRLALKHIPAERLVLSSNCGMGPEGMARLREALSAQDRLTVAQRRATNGAAPHRFAARRLATCRFATRQLATCRFAAC